MRKQPANGVNQSKVTDRSELSNVRSNKRTSSVTGKMPKDVSENRSKLIKMQKSAATFIQQQKKTTPEPEEKKRADSRGSDINPRSSILSSKLSQKGRVMNPVASQTPQSMKSKVSGLKGQKTTIQVAKIDLGSNG